MTTNSQDLPSWEVQGQLVGFSWVKVYYKNERAPGNLLLPNQFQKHLNSLLLIGQKIIFRANQRKEDLPGDSDAFSYKVVFLIDRRTSCPTSCSWVSEDDHLQIGKKYMNTCPPVAPLAPAIPMSPASPCLQNPCS